MGRTIILAAAARVCQYSPYNQWFGNWRTERQQFKLCFPLGGLICHINLYINCDYGTNLRDDVPFVERTEAERRPPEWWLMFLSTIIDKGVWRNYCLVRYEGLYRVRLETCSIVREVLKPEIPKIRSYNSLRVHMATRLVKSNEEPGRGPPRL